MVVMIALAVLLFLVAAAIEINGTANEGAIASARADEMQACAAAARRVLLSRLPNITLGGAPSPDGQPVVSGSFTMDTRTGYGLPTSATAAEQNYALTGHLDDTAVQTSIVSLNASAMGSAANSMRSVANTAGVDPVTTAQFYRVAVTCHHPNSNAKSELEFTVRHGF